jgi:hypothetical protein
VRGKTPFLEPFRYKNDQFAKAGSGQTSEKLRKKVFAGGPGDPGWEIRNGTGGGGPDFARFDATGGLSADTVEVCRRRCCETHYCVSIVLHAGGCYLNNASGTMAPYSRPATLMAFVKRNPAA